MERSGRGLSALLILLIMVGCGGVVRGNLKKSPAPLKYDEVRSEIERVYPELLLCYHSSLKGGEIFYGKTKLIISIDRRGRIYAVDWKPRPPERFYACTREVLSEIHFRELPDKVKIEIPIKFTLEMEEKK